MAYRPARPFISHDDTSHALFRPASVLPSAVIDTRVRRNQLPEELIGFEQSLINRGPKPISYPSVAIQSDGDLRRHLVARLDWMMKLVYESLCINPPHLLLMESLPRIHDSHNSDFNLSIRQGFAAYDSAWRFTFAISNRWLLVSTCRSVDLKYFFDNNWIIVISSRISGCTNRITKIVRRHSQMQRNFTHRIDTTYSDNTYCFCVQCSYCFLSNKWDQTYFQLNEYQISHVFNQMRMKVKTAQRRLGCSVSSPWARRGNVLPAIIVAFGAVCLCCQTWWITLSKSRSHSSQS